ncbi:tyrosine-type recombinase/integrase [Myxococcota bacterium]
MPRFRAFKREPVPFDFLDFDEAARLEQAADGQWRLLIVVALHTGLRMGELLALRWEDADLVAGRIVVRQSDWKGHIVTPKSGRWREIPLNAKVLKALKSHRHLRGPLVFCEEDGTALTYKQMHRGLMLACRRAGLRLVQWHCLRHSFASHMVTRGVPLKAVQELLGHASIEMTMRYAHLSPDVRRDAVDALLDQWRHNGCLEEKV